MHDPLTVAPALLKKKMYIMLFTFKGVVWSLENMPSLSFIFHNLCIENTTKVKKNHKNFSEG